METFGTAKASDAAINSFVNKILDCSVEGILEGLQLCCLIYLATATYGHFGRVGFTWEELAVNA